MGKPSWWVVEGRTWKAHMKATGELPYYVPLGWEMTRCLMTFESSALVKAKRNQPKCKRCQRAVGETPTGGGVRRTPQVVGAGQVQLLASRKTRRHITPTPTARRCV